MIASARDRPKWPLSQPFLRHRSATAGGSCRLGSPALRKPSIASTCSPKPCRERVQKQTQQGAALKAVACICGCYTRRKADRQPRHRHPEPIQGCLQNPTDGGGPQRSISGSSESPIPIATIFSHLPTARTFLFLAIVWPVL